MKKEKKCEHKWVDGVCSKCGEPEWYSKEMTNPPSIHKEEENKTFDGHDTKFCPAFVGNGKCDCSFLKDKKEDCEQDEHKGRTPCRHTEYWLNELREQKEKAFEEGKEIGNDDFNSLKEYIKHSQLKEIRERVRGMKRPNRPKRNKLIDDLLKELEK